MEKVIVDDLNFKDEVLKETMPLMVEFYATWCQHCKNLEPIINDLHKKYGDKVKFVMVDIDEAPHYTNEMSVKTTPTLFFYKDGKGVKKIVGPRTKDMIENTLKSII
ncbi:MAG: thioredoxin [Elusimicrobiaceae bacterium]|jgi:thioredoxin 1|nr:thioredoxin [Elusimicrobiaceae bacterium]